MTSMKSTTIQISKLPHALNKLITRYPYYDTVHIITDSHIARISSTTIQTTIDSYSDIYEIISKSPSYARIVAKSGDMLFVEEDTFSFHVQHTTFTKLPNVKSKYDKKVKVVKMKSGIVKIIIVGMIEELKFMIKKVFDNQESEVTVYGLVNEETKGIFSFDKYLFKEVPLWVTDYDELTLLVNYGIDGFVKGDAFTSFEVTDDEYGEYMYRYTLKNTTSKVLTDLDWNTMSLQNSDHHLLIRRINESEYQVYEVNRKE